MRRGAKKKTGELTKDYNPRLKGVIRISVKVAYLLFGFSLYSRSNLCPSSYSLAIGNESVKKGEIGLTHNPK